MTPGIVAFSSAANNAVLTRLWWGTPQCEVRRCESVKGRAARADHPGVRPRPAEPAARGLPPTPGVPAQPTPSAPAPPTPGPPARPTPSAPPQPIPLPFGRPVRRRRWLRALVLVVLALIGVGLKLRPAVKYYKVSSGSMEPTLQVGQRVAADPQAHTPKVGEIIVFHAPQGADPAVPVCGAGDEGAGSTQPCGMSTSQESSTTFIKRVVAGPGDLISVVDGHAVLNGVTEHEPNVAGCSDPTRCSFPTPVRVPAGDYYVLGDNRGSSDDSRFWGPVPSAWIMGTVVRCSLWGTVCHPVR